MKPEERIAAVQRFADAYMGRLGDMAEIITEEMGSPISFSNLGQAPAAWMMLNTFIGIAQQFPWEDARTGHAGHRRDRALRAGRRRRRHRAVERPPVRDDARSSARRC